MHLEDVAIEIVAPSIELVTPKYFPNWTDSLQLIEECGRVSHKSEGRMEPGSAEPFIRRIAMESGHESIVEHFGFTVACVCDRSTSHQWVRHRLSTYTQESQRYCDYSKTKKYGDCLKVLMPPTYADRILWGQAVRWIGGAPMVVTDNNVVFVRDFVKDHGGTKEQADRAARWCDNRLAGYYNYQLDRRDGIPAEDARGNLDNCCKTEIYTTSNFRQWRHFFDMRHEGHAQWQIRMLAGYILQAFKREVPVLVEDKTVHEEWL